MKSRWETQCSFSRPGLETYIQGWKETNARFEALHYPQGSNQVAIYTTYNRSCGWKAAEHRFWHRYTYHYGGITQGFHLTSNCYGAYLQTHDEFFQREFSQWTSELLTGQRTSGEVCRGPTQVKEIGLKALNPCLDADGSKLSKIHLKKIGT